MNRARIIVINALVFLALLVGIEAILRVSRTVQTCFARACQFHFVTGIRISDARQDFAAQSIGMMRVHDRLGHVPREGFDATIHHPERGWWHARISISDEGFRLNDNAGIPARAGILVVGDSFTFGDQVSNHETWPSCLERRLQKRVDNGGVSGYGAAQSLRRAMLQLGEKQYSTLVLSILVEHDFARDGLWYRSGSARPALIRTSDGIAWSAMPDPNRPGTKFNPSDENRHLIFWYERSILAYHIIRNVFPDIDLTGDRLTEAHPDAVDKHTAIVWTLTEFANLPIAGKLILLQYRSGSVRNRVSPERDDILAVGRGLSLRIVDTFDELKKHGARTLWSNHHTAFGNEVVCDYLFHNGLK